MNEIVSPVYVDLSVTSNIEGIYYSRILHVQFALHYILQAIRVPFKNIYFYFTLYSVFTLQQYNIVLCKRSLIERR